MPMHSSWRSALIAEPRCDSAFKHTKTRFGMLWCYERVFCCLGPNMFSLCLLLESYHSLGQPNQYTILVYWPEPKCPVCWQCFCFQNQIFFSGDTLFHKRFWWVTKINNCRGGLTDTSAKKDTLFVECRLNGAMPSRWSRPCFSTWISNFNFEFRISNFKFWKLRNSKL